MATAQFGALRGAPTTSDLSAKTGYAVVVTAGVLAIAGAEVVIDGVLVDDPKNGQTGTYQIRDVVKAIAGAAITINANLMTTAAGKFVTATTGKPIVGKALEAAGADLDVIKVELGYRGLSA
jgi:fermentation-respiration switch protein FrsA (DUF1100 family)